MPLRSFLLLLRSAVALLRGSVLLTCWLLRFLPVRKPMTDETPASDAAGTTDEQPQHHADTEGSGAEPAPAADDTVPAQDEDAMVDLSSEGDDDGGDEGLPPSVKESLEKAVDQGTARRLDEDDPDASEPADDEFQDLDDSEPASESMTEPSDTPTDAPAADTVDESPPEPASDTVSQATEQASVTDQPEPMPDEGDTNAGAGEPAADADESEVDEDEIPNVSGEELDFEGLNEGDGEEEWTWGREKDSVTFEYKGMTVEMSEPEDDDSVINAMRESAPEGGDPEEMSRLDRMKIYVQLAVDRPNITDERWEDHMTPTEKLTIGSIAMQYLESEDFTTGPGGGPSPLQD